MELRQLGNRWFSPTVIRNICFPPLNGPVWSAISLTPTSQLKFYSPGAKNGFRRKSEIFWSCGTIDTGTFPANTVFRQINASPSALPADSRSYFQKIPQKKHSLHFAYSLCFFLFIKNYSSRHNRRTSSNSQSAFSETALRSHSMSLEK